MTPEERQEQAAARNCAICAYYTQGHSVKECASMFQLGRQRVTQILQTGGVWRPYKKADRTKFLGVTVSEETKAALARHAEVNHTSVSKLVSDKLTEVFK